jgi:hypothetical protein
MRIAVKVIAINSMLVIAGYTASASNSRKNHREDEYMVFTLSSVVAQNAGCSVWSFNRQTIQAAAVPHKQSH